MFLVVKGRLTMRCRAREMHVEEGEFIIVPRGVEHRPLAADEVELMLFEPATTLNTGDQQHALTKTSLDKI